MFGKTKTIIQTTNLKSLDDKDGVKFLVNKIKETCQNNDIESARKKLFNWWNKKSFVYYEEIFSKLMQN